MTALADPHFMANVRNAQAQGYHIVCAHCGKGIYVGPGDGSDQHDPYCPRRA